MRNREKLKEEISGQEEANAEEFMVSNILGKATCKTIKIREEFLKKYLKNNKHKFL